LPTSFFRFVGQDAPELSPALVEDVLGEHRSAKNTHVKILDRDEIESVDQRMDNLEMVVTPDTGLMKSGACEPRDRLAPSVRTFLLASHRALEISDPLLSMSLDARPNDLLAGRESRENRDTKVNADRLPRLRQGGWLREHGLDAGVPMAPLTFDRDCLANGVLWDRSVQLHLHMPDASPVNAADIVVQRSFATILGLQGVLAALSFESGESRLLPPLYSAKEPSKGVLESPESVLLRRATHTFWPQLRARTAQFRELAGLLKI
jgi:hypothetical protein